MDIKKKNSIINITRNDWMCLVIPLFQFGFTNL